MRTRSSLRALPLVVFVIAGLAGWPEAVGAKSNDPVRGWVLRVSPTWVDSERGGGTVIGYRGGVASGLEPQDVGLGVSGEYRFSPRLGLEIGALAFSNGVGVVVRDGVVVASGTSSYGSITLGPDVHLTSNGRADLFVGPFLAYTAHTDVGFYDDEWAGVRIGGSFGWGAVLGVDVPVGERGWRLSANVRYIDTNLGGTDWNGDPFEVDFGPTAVGVGFGYRF